MKFNQRAVIPVGREPLWDFLMDVPKVAQSLPGVESVSQLDGTTYQGTLKVRVGPISLNLQGKIILEERDRGRWRAALRAEANDRRAAGAVKGKTTMELAESSYHAYYEAAVSSSILYELIEKNLRQYHEANQNKKITRSNLNPPPPSPEN